MKAFLVLLSLIATINCQVADSGFRLDALKILGGGSNNGQLNNGQFSLNNGQYSLNNGQLNNGQFNNGQINNGQYNLNNGQLNNGQLNSGLNNQNGLMGMILGGQQSSNTNNQMMMTGSNNNNFGSQPTQMPARFTDDLQYPQNPPPIPVPSGPLPTLEDYKREDLRESSQFLTAPGRFAPITNIPQLPILTEQPQYGSNSRTANLKNDPRVNNPDFKQFLFNFEVPTNPGVMPSRNQGADDRIDQYLQSIGIPNQSVFKNGLFQNQQNTARPNYGQISNNGLNTNNNNNNNLNTANLFDNGLYNPNNAAGNTGLSSNLVASTMPYGSANNNGAPMEVSQFSTSIVHDQPSKLSQSRPY